MALTKPAGCFLQLLSVPVFLWGFVLTASGFGPGPDASTATGLFGVLVIVGAAALLVVGRRPATSAPSGPTRKCPACAEEILAAAKKCKHCGEVLDTEG